MYLELAVAAEVDVDEQQPAAAIQEHDAAVVEMQATCADKHEPALRSDSGSDYIHDDCLTLSFLGRSLGKINFNSRFIYVWVITSILFHCFFSGFFYLYG